MHWSLLASCVSPTCAWSFTLLWPRPCVLCLASPVLSKTEPSRSKGLQRCQCCCQRLCVANHYRSLLPIPGFPGFVLGRFQKIFCLYPLVLSTLCRVCGAPRDVVSHILRQLQAASLPTGPIVISRPRSLLRNLPPWCANVLYLYPLQWVASAAWPLTTKSMTVVTPFAVALQSVWPQKRSLQDEASWAALCYGVQAAHSGCCLRLIRTTCAQRRPAAGEPPRRTADRLLLPPYD